MFQVVIKSTQKKKRDYDCEEYGDESEGGDCIVKRVRKEHGGMTTAS